MAALYFIKRRIRTIALLENWRLLAVSALALAVLKRQTENAR
jgi:hypothetical protein